MVLQCMILVLSELCDNRSQTQPSVMTLLRNKNHSYNKWTQVLLHQDPNRKQKKKCGNHFIFPLEKLVVQKAF